MTLIAGSLADPSVFARLWISVDASAIQIPAGEDWSNRGPIKLGCAPDSGPWDCNLRGALANPGSIVKLRDTYYLYYIGSVGHRKPPNDEGPADRSIGVMTSVDGVKWTAHAGNPLITHKPNACSEEGVFSLAPVVFDDTVYLYFGQLEAIRDGAACRQVKASIAVATSRDGTTFGPANVLIDGLEDDCAGCGDEIYPMSAFRHPDGTWYVYYISSIERFSELFLTSGASYDSLEIGTESDRRILSGKDLYWSMGPPAFLDEDTFALFYTTESGSPSRKVKVRAFKTSNPYQPSRVLEVYDEKDSPFARNMLASTYLDTDRWIMAYGDCQEGPCKDGAVDAYKIRTAPVMSGTSSRAKP
jgi:hypothetical protein